MSKSYRGEDRGKKIHRTKREHGRRQEDDRSINESIELYSDEGDSPRESNNEEPIG